MPVKLRAALFTLLSLVLSFRQSFALEERSLYGDGGWGLIVKAASDCPAGTQGHLDVSVIVCCPTNYTSPDTENVGARICCAPGTDCLQSFQAAPYCADSTWVLWNHTLQGQGSFFCCLPGQQGEESDNTVGCINGSLDPGDTAAQSISVNQITSTGIATATSTGGSTGTPTILPSSTTTKGSGSSTSTLPVTTSHSSSRKIEPGSFNILSLGVLGCGFTLLALIGGFTLF